MNKHQVTATVYQHEEDAVCAPSVFDPVSPCGMIQQQIRWIMRIAAALCTISSIIDTGTDPIFRSIQLLHWAIWWLVLWLVKGGKESDKMIRWGQYNIIATMTTMYFLLNDTPTTLSWIMLAMSLGCFVTTNRVAMAMNTFVNDQQPSQQDNGYCFMMASPAASTSWIEQPTNNQSEELESFSRELQEAARMVITTLEQFSPATILTNTHELLSACSIAVPIASISAIHTTAQQICYISHQLEPATTIDEDSPSNNNNNPIAFDIGDLVQNAADALAGMAAKLDVNLILYHADNGMHHANVFGDPEPIRHALLTLVWNILEGCTPGACIELGLNVTPGSSTSTTSPFLSVPQPLHVILEVIHTASPAIPHSLSHALLPRTIATERLLTSMGGQLHINTLAENRTRYEMTIDMEMSPSNQHQGPAGQRKLLLLDDPGSSFSLSNTNNATSTKHHHTSFSKDPTLSDLAKFIERLNGVKMVLHAREKSVFARHLTSCLASWNADISHVPVGVLTVRESDDEEDNDDAKKKQEQPVVPSPAIAEEQLHSVPPTFILIDDDIETLENKLKAFHNHQRRPSAQQQQQQHKGGRQHKNAKYTAAIIHFTSLTNYKRLRDMVHSMPIPPNGMPRLVVVPKPAGPRRFLTALHTGWHDATVEPHFMPIATSPSSPSLWMMGEHHAPYQQQHQHATTPAPMTGRKDGYMTPHVHEQGNHRRGMSPSSSPGSSMTTAAADQNANNNGYFNVLRGQSSRPLSPAPTTTSNSNRQHKSSPLGVGDDNEGEQGVNERGDETMLFSSSSSPSSQLPPSYPPSVNNNNNNNRASPPHNTDQKGLPTSTLPPETPAETPAHDEREKKDDADTTTSDAANAKVSPSQENKPHHEEMDREVAVGGGVGHEKPSLINSLRRKRTVRLSKKLKSDRGSSSGAFANTVSPPINVLIVEDNMINQAILSTWMKKHKIKCSVASNGQEAVERWKGGGFHLVLMDIQLPVMDGITATKTIRSIEKEQRIGVLPAEQDTTTIASSSSSSLQQVPEDTQVSSFQSPVIIVALTASAKDSDRHAALAAGCNDFLTKPISLEWLEKKIIEWGCMQALIDFEGWRRWKRSSSTTSVSNSLSSKASMIRPSESNSARPSAAINKEKNAAAKGMTTTCTKESTCDQEEEEEKKNSDDCSRRSNVHSTAAATTTTEHPSSSSQPRKGFLLLGSAGSTNAVSPATMVRKSRINSSSSQLQLSSSSCPGSIPETGAPHMLNNRAMSMLAVGQRQHSTATTPDITSSNNNVEEQSFISNEQQQPPPSTHDTHDSSTTNGVQQL